MAKMDLMEVLMRNKALRSFFMRFSPSSSPGTGLSERTAMIKLVLLFGLQNLQASHKAHELTPEALQTLLSQSFTATTVESRIDSLKQDMASLERSLHTVSGNLDTASEVLTTPTTQPPTTASTSASTTTTSSAPTPAQAPVAASPPTPPSKSTSVSSSLDAGQGREVAATTTQTSQLENPEAPFYPKPSDRWRKGSPGTPILPAYHSDPDPITSESEGEADAVPYSIYPSWYPRIASPEKKVKKTKRRKSRPDPRMAYSQPKVDSSDPLWASDLATGKHVLTQEQRYMEARNAAAQNPTGVAQPHGLVEGLPSEESSVSTTAVAGAFNEHGVHTDASTAPQPTQVQVAADHLAQALSALFPGSAALTGPAQTNQEPTSSPSSPSAQQSQSKKQVHWAEEDPPAPHRVQAAQQQRKRLVSKAKAAAASVTGKTQSKGSQAPAPWRGSGAGGDKLIASAPPRMKGRPPNMSTPTVSTSNYATSHHHHAASKVFHPTGGPQTPAAAPKYHPHQEKAAKSTAARLANVQSKIKAEIAAAKKAAGTYRAARRKALEAAVTGGSTQPSGMAQPPPSSRRVPNPVPADPELDALLSRLGVSAPVGPGHAATPVKKPSPSRLPPQPSPAPRKPEPPMETAIRALGEPETAASPAVMKQTDAAPGGLAFDVSLDRRRTERNQPEGVTSPVAAAGWHSLSSVPGFHETEWNFDDIIRR